MWQDELDRAVDEKFEAMVAVRRRLHARPELSGEETDTSLYLYQLLGDEGFQVRLGAEGRGLIADLGPASMPAEGVVALRADIDALHIHDEKKVSYRSQNDGVMHACGHDAHTAVVYGALSAIRGLTADGALPVDLAVRGVFQPAEETCVGAKEMILVGALEGVAVILGLHVDPTRDIGRVGLRDGLLTANCDDMRINILGRGGHAARPHEASDPIAAAAQLINALYLFIPRATDSQDAVVVTIGHIEGGEHSNVIPEQVHLAGTVRTLDPAVRRQTFEHIRRLAHGIGQTTDTRIDVNFGVGCQSVKNDPALVELLRRACGGVLGPGGVEIIPRPSMGSEDFAFYLEHRPGAMLRLGCRSKETGAAPLHTPCFDVDEEALRIGAKILARAAVLWAQDAKRQSGGCQGDDAPIPSPSARGLG